MLVLMLAASAGATNPTSGPLAPGNHNLPIASVGVLISLSRYESNWHYYNQSAARGQWPTPAARSYDGRAWEPTHDAAIAISNCTSTYCVIHVPNETNAVYGLDKYNLSAWRPPNEQRDAKLAAVKLLEQGTFGPTRSSVLKLSEKILLNGSSAFSMWIDEQFRAPATLHRAYFRARAAPRGDLPSFVGTFSVACREGSLWIRYAFTLRDVGAALRVQLKTSGYLSLTLDAEVRAEVAVPTKFDPRRLLVNATSPVWSGYVCQVTERIGGDLHIGASCNVTAKATWTKVNNVALQFIETIPTNRLEVSSAEAPLAPVPNLGASSNPASINKLTPTRDEVFTLTALHVPCPLDGVHAQLVAFMRRAGVWYRHDPRLVMIDNDLASPANIRVPLSERLPGEACPRVEKSFLNAHTCVRRPACAAVVYSATTLTLTPEVLRKFWTLGNVYLYAMDGLRLEGDYHVSPCSGASRWRSLRRPCRDREETALDDATRHTLVAAVRTSANRSNPYVRTAHVNNGTAPGNVNGTCITALDGVSAIGAKIGVDGVCWEHSHPHVGNVYDATAWRYDHDGTSEFPPARNPIGAFAERPSANVTAATTLRYPASHSMDRWTQRVVMQRHMPLIGALGESVRFDNLPLRVQSPRLAAAFGANASLSSDAPEVCGSPGEVANDMSVAGDLFPLFWGSSSTGHQRFGRPELYMPQERGWISVLPNVAFKATDQLRQRQAWALSQVFVVSQQGFQTSQSEGWLAYYDICEWTGRTPHAKLCRCTHTRLQAKPNRTRATSQRCATPCHSLEPTQPMISTFDSRVRRDSRSPCFRKPS